jgi:hypothetical protein
MVPLDAIGLLLHHSIQEVGRPALASRKSWRPLPKGVGDLGVALVVPHFLAPAAAYCGVSMMMIMITMLGVGDS